jgi:LPS-assembly protein
MTGPQMRSLSLRATFCVLLMTMVLLSSPVLRQAFAQPGITVGFAIDDSRLIASPRLAEDVGLYLEKQLSMPVHVRSFTTETALYNWLVRYREVDFAWLSKDLLNAESGGEFYQLVENRAISSELSQGSVVARQGLEKALLRQVSAVFLSMHENSEGQALLAKLEIRRFVTTSLWHTPEGIGVAPIQADQSSSPAAENPWTIPVKSETSDAKLSSAPLVAEDSQVDEDIPTKTEALRTPSLARPADSSTAETSDIKPITKAYSQEDPVVEKQPDSVDDSLPLKENGKGETETVIESVPASGQETPIALAADYLAYNSNEDSYEAKGDVVLRQAEVELKAESLLWQAATQDVAAEGSVQLEDAGSMASGTSMNYNMATRQGQIRDGRVYIREGNFRLAGQQIEKESQFEYSVKEGSFTTCDGEIPDWKFTAEEVDVTIGDYARGKHVWFHIKDVPVLYTPYLSFPVKTERESGMLTPAFGYSNNKGARLSLAWYQVIDRHMDATVYLDYLSEIGLGKGLEYRYALSGQNKGKALYYHVTGLGDIEEQGPNRDFPDIDYYKWEHRGNLPGDWRLVADVEYTDNKLFFEEFGESAEDYSQDKTVSTLMLSHNWQKLNLVGHARYIKDLDSNNDTTLQRLPELGVGLPRYRLGDTPLYAGLESYATNFWREEGEDGERLYLRPSLSAALKPGSWLEVTPEVAFYERLYSSDAADNDKFVPEFSVALSTRLVKSFDVDLFGADRLQHSIEPTVTYTYVPDEEQDDLPLFDLNDRIASRKDVTYALVNRLTARSQSADGSSLYREIFYLRLSQRYNIDEPQIYIEDVVTDRSVDNRPFSDLRIELDFKPVKYFSLDAESLIPVYGDTGFNTLRVGSTLKDDMGNAARANYAYNDIEFSGVATDYVEFQLNTSFFRPVYASFKERYDFRKERELEKVVGLEYRSKCWSILLTYRNRYREIGDDDQEIMFAFVLAGLGGVQGFGM